MKKAALHNLGCKVNAYETEAMQHMLEEAGYEIVSFGEFADIYVINTCSVTNMADRKSRQMLHRAKKMNPDAIVVATGCYVQTKEQEALKDSAIDIIIGNNKKHELVQSIKEYEDCHKNTDNSEFSKFSEDSKGRFQGCKSGAAWNHVVDINHGKQKFEELYLDRTAEHTRAFIKVQDGCNQFCSYCMIPYARGRVRSRKMDSVIAEVARLARNGYQEVVLTGIHLSSYGIDIGDNLLHLIQEVHKVDGIRRIRLGSLEPRLITEEFVKNLSTLQKVCPHFHLSLQSGCDETLKRMNRKYNTREFEQGCNILRKYFEHPAITTDVIVGFPGETEEEFEKTKEFLSRICFYEMHIFKYSIRQGTKAADMPNQIAEEIKTRRSAELIALGEKMSEEFRAYYMDTVQEVLFEECSRIDDASYYIGYTREYIKVAVPTFDNLENTMKSGRICGKIAADILLLFCC